MLFIVGIVLLIIIGILYEIRIRRPDHLILYESRGKVRIRRSRFYPRHFSQAIPGTIHSKIVDIEAEARGKLLLNIRLALSVAASPEHLHALIRTGGWSFECVSKAMQELIVMLQSQVKEFVEQQEIDEMKSESLSSYLNKKLGKTVDILGLDIITLNVQAVDPISKEIAEALRQRESSRIMEQTEKAKQEARVAAVNSKIDADEKVSLKEHALELKKYDMRKTTEKNEADLADKRISEELKRREKQLEFDRKELELLKNNPELLILTPQVARLAEASQNLKNAKTIVSLSPNDLAQGSQFLTTIHTFMQKVLETADKNKSTKS